MSYYQKKISELNNRLFPNEAQLQTVIGIKNYIDNNFESNLNLDYLAHQRFVSKYHLLRLFKRYYGQTPRQYLIDLRIKRAKEKLQKGISVSDTCYAIGFESVSSFSNLFKTRTGKSTSTYQKQQLSRSQLDSNC